jgi:hypothetical protein
MPHAITCSCCQCQLQITRDSPSPWLTCPRCLGQLINPRALIRPGSSPGDEASLDDEVRRDRLGGTFAAIVLCVLLPLGVIVSVSSGGPKLVSASKEGPAVFGLGVLILGSIFICTVMTVSSSKDLALRAATGVVGGLLVGAGMVVLLIILFWLAIVESCQTGK